MPLLVKSGTNINLKSNPICIHSLKGPSIDILEVIAYPQMPLISVHADVFSKSRGINFGLILNLDPNFDVYMNNKCSGEFAHMRKLTRPFAAR